MRSKLQTTQKIVQSAADLFLDRGFYNVSMDLIAETAHITKVTVYQHFKSKEVLLLHCMRWRLESREAYLDIYLRERAPSKTQVLEVFDWMSQKADRGTFHGCAFLKATNEMGGTLAEVREIAAEAKQLIRKRLLALLRKSGVPQPDHLADTLALLLEGAQALSLIEQSNRPFQAARREACELLAPFLTAHGTVAQPAAFLVAQKGI
ncbi:MAG: TetR/AcrR family transcriptional regulator [Acidobacteria bacterium]|nr:TetR/AcrR family transcriptional regulator [Acidobacteriota bacterium]